jgi:hypothetical protein
LTAKTPSGVLLILRIAIVALPLVALFAPKQAHAYAWMIKRGYPSCPACHADPSGGELLTGYGRMISELTLSTNWSGDGGSGANQHGLSRKLALRSPESFAAGAKGAGPEKVTLDEDTSADADKDGDADKDSDATAKEGEAPAAEGEAAPAEASSSDSSSSGDSTFANFLFGAVTLPDWLLLGGSYRHLNILKLGDEKDFSTFPMMMDLYGQVKFGAFSAGGSIGAVRVAAGSPYARRAQVTANQGKDWNLISRTHYLGYDVVPEVTVRAGRLNLPFGVRIPEHTMWVRQATNTDRESSQQHGLAIAYVGESFRGEVMGIAGNYQVRPDKFRERGYAGYLEYSTGASATIGVSSMLTYSATDPVTRGALKTQRQVHGLMGRAGFGEKVALLAEANGIFTSRREPGYVGFVQLDVEAVQGLHFLATGEMLDQGYIKQVPGGLLNGPRTAGEGKPKVGGWLSVAWFVYSHFDVRFDAIKRTGEDVTVLGQLHVYL